MTTVERPLRALIIDAYAVDRDGVRRALRDQARRLDALVLGDDGPVQCLGRGNDDPVGWVAVNRAPEKTSRERDVALVDNEPRERLLARGFERASRERPVKAAHAHPTTASTPRREQLF